MDFLPDYTNWTTLIKSTNFFEDHNQTARCGAFRVQQLANHVAFTMESRPIHTAQGRPKSTWTRNGSWRADHESHTPPMQTQWTWGTVQRRRQPNRSREPERCAERLRKRPEARNWQQRTLLEKKTVWNRQGEKVSPYTKPLWTVEREKKNAKGDIRKPWEFQGFEWL